MTYLTSVANGIADGGSTTHDSLSLTVSGTNKVMWALVANSDGSPAAPSGVVWDPAGGAQALTLLGSAITFGTYANASLWRLIAPSDATGVVRATWGASKGERAIVVWVETGIDQTTPNGTVASANGAIGVSTVSAGAVTTTAGQRVVNLAHALRTGVFSGPTEFDSPTGTERHDLVTSGTAYDAVAAQEQTASGSSATPQWTLNEVSDGWASFAFALNIAGAAAQLSPRQRRPVARPPAVPSVRRRRARITLPAAPAASTGATGRAGLRGDAVTVHGVSSPSAGRAGARGAAPAAKAATLGADGRAAPRADASTAKGAATVSDGRLSLRGSVVAAEGAVHGATGRAGALGSVATVAGFGAVTQATGRAGATGASPSAKESPSGAMGRAGATGTVIAAKGSTVQADGRAGPRADASASKAAQHGASGSLAARGSALSAEGAVHSAAGRLGARASVTTAAAFGLTTVAGGRVGARGSTSATKAVAADAAGRAGPRADVAAAKATAHASAGLAGLRGAVDTSGIPPIETTAVGRLAVRGAAITVQGPAGSISSGSSGVGRLVTPSYRMRPPRRKRREEEDRQEGAAVDLAPGQLAGTAAMAAAHAAGAAPAQPEPVASVAPAERWRLAREQDREFETKVLHLI